MLRDDPAAGRRTLADVVVRLRCDACSARPASVHLTETALPPDVRGDVVPGWNLLLHGAEAGSESARVAEEMQAPGGPGVG